MGDIYFLKIFHEFQKNKSIKDVLQKLKREIDYKGAISYFKNPVVNNNVGNLNIKESNLDELEDQLVNKYGLIKYKLKKKIEILRIFQKNK